MNFLAQIARCNQFSPTHAHPFFVEHQQIGWIKNAHATALHDYSDIFVFSNQRIQLHPQLSTYDQRTAALATVVSTLKKQGRLSNWRGELYDIAPSYGEKPLFALERGATAFFGVPACGTHLNGFTYKNKELYIWVARRSAHCLVAPGRLDNLSAGGLPKDTTPLQNVIKEAWEEAKLPTALSKKAAPRGWISYLMDTPEGIIPGTMFVFDLELFPTIIPLADGEEIESFFCLPAAEVYRLIKNTQVFKYNSALVMIDFLIRKNIITPTESDYSELKTHLQQPFLFMSLLEVS
jgi:8-oxo-dGTP pyrophosphatase MutT (NUDIX family)